MLLAGTKAVTLFVPLWYSFATRKPNETSGSWSETAWGQTPQP